MEKEFVQYQEALVLKELGFVEPCIGWMRDWAKDVCLGKHEPSHHHESSCNAILYQQAFRFFREKYNLLGSIDYSNRLKWYYVIREFITSDILPNLNTSSKGEFESYEEAELECLKKLIEIVKENNGRFSRKKSKRF